MSRAYDNFNLNSSEIQLIECAKHPGRIIRRVGTAEEHEYITYNTGARLRLISGAAKLLAQ